MGVITPDRFNPISAYCNVRLQQGVPLVDADVNELDDIRKFEVRAFLKWFVGNGIPDGNDGFRIAALAAPSATDFQILNGTPAPAGGLPAAPSVAANEYVLQGFGRCIVDGLDVIIQASTTYGAQALSTFDKTPPYSLPPVAAVPNVTTPVLVYLDVWERAVYPTEDTNLVVPPLGTESCARIKRQWVVRTRQGSAVPVSGDTDFIANHLYYGLATINRPTVGALITASTITDVREQGLSIGPSNLIVDALGGTVSAYRQGKNRPAISLRQAINALARGEVPAQPEQPLSAVPVGPTEAAGRAALDGSNGLVLAWVAGAATVQVYVGRLDLGNPGAGFASATAITTGPNNHTGPSVVSLPGGDLLVAYWGTVGSLSDIHFRRGATPALLQSATEVNVTIAGTPAQSATFPLVVASNNIVVFFFMVAGVYQYRRYNAVSSTFMDQNPVAIPDANVVGDLHAAVDASGNVWVAYATTTAPAGIRLVQLNATTLPTMTQVSTLSAPSGAGDGFHAPFVLCGTGQTWAFWQGNAGISQATVGGPALSATGPVTILPYTLAGDNHPVAAFDAVNNRVAVAYSRALPPSTGITNVVLAHGDPTSGGWLPPAAATVSALSDVFGVAGHPYAGGLFQTAGSTFQTAGSMWMIWIRQNVLTQSSRVYYRQICYPL